MSTISLDDVKKLASLSALSLSDEQLQAMKRELSEILGYVEQLQSVDTEGMEPTYQVNGLETVTRPDEVIDYGVSQQELLKNAPKISGDVQKDGMIVVPRVLE
jgi:aspartyl-tRNA(Asn)/glutamyl-tRNA(Gln) amidotransferase subunit C